MIHYEFFTEDGHFKLTYQDYVNSPDLMAKISDEERPMLNLGLRIFNFDFRWLGEHREARKVFDYWKEERRKNPLRFYLPHCAASQSFDESAMHRFINDDKHIFTGFIGPNRTVKTTATWV